MRVEPHAAYLLHSRKYRETSAIIEILSKYHGRVSCIQKGAFGAKKRSQAHALQPFHALLLGWVGKTDLPTLNAFEQVDKAFKLNGRALYCGMYVNELIVRLVGRGEANNPLFDLYESVLTDLSNEQVPLEQTLRRFEKYLLEMCGYGLLLSCEGASGEMISPDKQYFYHLEHGPETEKLAPDDVEISGQTLLKLAGDQFLDEHEAQQAKRLMRRALARYLGDKPLASRSLFE